MLVLVIPNNPNTKTPVTNALVYVLKFVVSAFAKRFGMPQQWIDDDLKGAEALAYRLDLDVYGTKGGYFSDVENCRPTNDRA
jgi:hypothetical protein